MQYRPSPRRYSTHALVAQLAEASVSNAECWGFDSPREHHGSSGIYPIHLDNMAADRTHMRRSDADVEAAVRSNVSTMGVLRTLGIRPAGGSHSNMKRRIDRMGLDTSHFTGTAHNKGRPPRNRKTSKEILVVLPQGSIRQKLDQLRRALAEESVPIKCTRCGMEDSWQGKPIVLEVDHKDGDWLDNRLDNLQYMCPNCHSQKTRGV